MVDQSDGVAQEPLVAEVQETVVLARAEWLNKGDAAAAEMKAIQALGLLRRSKAFGGLGIPHVPGAMVGWAEIYQVGQTASKE